MNYSLIYNNIINKALSLDRKKGEAYYEKHHILPKCLGGSNEKSNLVLLTPKEHYLCHKLLTYIYPENNALVFAFWSMSRSSKNQDRYVILAKEYENLKNKIKDIRSKAWILNNPNNNRNNSGKNNPMYGTSRTGEQNPFFGKNHTEETKLKISVTNKGKTGYHNMRKVVIDSVEYKSLTFAAKTLNINISTLYRRINSKTGFSSYKYK